MKSSRGDATIWILIVVLGMLIMGALFIVPASAGIVANLTTNPLDPLNSSGNSNSPSGQELTFPANTDNSILKVCLDKYLDNNGAADYLKKTGETFTSAGQTNNVNPALMLAIGKQESSLGTTGIATQGGYNYYGLTDGSGGFRRFNTVDEAINYQAAYLREGYLDQGLVSIPAIGAKYAPPGAENDPTNLNSTWVDGVTKNFDEVTAVCPELQQTLVGSGKLDRIYLHWSAGGYWATFDDYHFNITGDGTVVKKGEPTDLKEHTWHRNTNAIGIAVSAMQDGTTNCYTDIYGSACPTPVKEIQLQSMAKLVAELSKTYDIPIDEEHIMTHAEAAKIDRYLCGATTESDCRWDFLGYGEQLRRMAKEKAGE